MRITNTTQRIIVLNYRDGRSFPVPALQYIIRPDYDVDYLDDTAVTLSYFSSGALTLTNDNGSAWSGTPLPGSPVASASGVSMTPALRPADPTAADSNLVAIQAALDLARIAGGGVVKLPAGGPYSISAGLTIGARTTLDATSSRIVASGGVGFTMLRNYSWNSAVLSVSSAAAVFNSTYHYATVTLQVANTFRPGDGILVKGVTPEVYNGVHAVMAATASSVTFVISLLSAAGQPTGTITVAAADIGIRLIGGEWDYDVVNNPPGADNLSTMLSIFNKVGDLFIGGGITLRGAPKYACYYGNAWTPKFDNVNLRTNSDGIHGHAPLRQVELQGIAGYTGDDFIAFTCSDNGYTQYALPDCAAAGDSVIGYSGRNLDVWNSATRIGGYTQNGVTCSGISYENVTWRNAQLYCYHFDTTTGATSGGFSDVTINGQRGYFAQNSPMMLLGSSGTMTFNNVDAQSIYPSTPVSQHFFNVAPNCTVKKLSVEKWARPAGSTGYAVNIANGATVENIYSDNFQSIADVTSLHSGVVFVDASGVCGTIVCENGVIDTNAGSSETITLVKSVASPALVIARTVRFRGRSHAWENSNTGKLVCDNCILDGGQSFWTTGNAADIQIIGGRVLSASQGVVNFYGSSKAYTIRSKGLDDGGVPWMPNYGAGSTYNFVGDCSDVPVDLTKVARLAGSMVKAVANTGAGGASDILANNVCVCDATGAAGSWKQQSAPTTRSY